MLCLLCPCCWYSIVYEGLTVQSIPFYVRLLRLRVSRIVSKFSSFQANEVLGSVGGWVYEFCVCVCVCEREREGEGGRKRERGREGGREREREYKKHR